MLKTRSIVVTFSHFATNCTAKMKRSREDKSSRKWNSVKMMAGDLWGTEEEKALSRISSESFHEPDLGSFVDTAANFHEPPAVFQEQENGKGTPHRRASEKQREKQVRVSGDGETRRKSRPITSLEKNEVVVLSSPDSAKEENPKTNQRKWSQKEGKESVVVSSMFLNGVFGEGKEVDGIRKIQTWGLVLDASLLDGPSKDWSTWRKAYNLKLFDEDENIKKLRLESKPKVASSSMTESWDQQDSKGKPQVNYMKNSFKDDRKDSLTNDRKDSLTNDRKHSFTDSAKDEKPVIEIEELANKFGWQESKQLDFREVFNRPFATDPKKTHIEGNEPHEYTVHSKEAPANPYASAICPVNGYIAEQLAKLVPQHKATGGKFNAWAITKACNILRMHPEPIKSGAQAKLIGGIGDRIAAKIDYIIKTGTLPQLSNERANVLAELNQVWGVGPATARRWYEEGIRNVSQLTNRKDLTTQQKLGLKYYNDLKLKISRDELVEHFRMIEVQLKKVAPDLVMIGGGSFRRGREFSGDVDIVVCHNYSHHVALNEVLTKLVDRLMEAGYIKDTLSGGAHSSHHGHERWHYLDKFIGICQLENSPNRQLDILVVPRENWACTLIYYTGSDYVNRSLRQWASDRGYKLCNDCLTAATNINGNHEHVPPFVPIETERDVFEFLGFSYLWPKDRDV